MKKTVTSDKIVSEVGTRDITTLQGSKEGNEILLTGTAAKTSTLSGLKNITDLSGLKHITDLSGLKHITDLSGLKHITNLAGTTDKSPILYGEAEEGYWHITVDTTYFYADNTFRTVDDYFTL